ncbi:hypothetical protein [Lentzea guizhouensis]|uniref:hypothetical protein n=1 Tax=Lentzea guizhouensis TaxID=1586287 RepID=UPI000AA41D9A|nr:hypothetical protein [Lentzea guizhouensis]
MAQLYARDVPAVFGTPVHVVVQAPEAWTVTGADRRAVKRAHGVAARRLGLRQPLHGRVAGAAMRAVRRLGVMVVPLPLQRHGAFGQREPSLVVAAGAEAPAKG